MVLPLLYIRDKNSGVKNKLQRTLTDSLDKNSRTTDTRERYKITPYRKEPSPSISINDGLYGPLGLTIKERVAQTAPETKPTTGP